MADCPGCGMPQDICEVGACPANGLVCAWCGKPEIDCEAAQAGKQIDLVPRREYERGRPGCLKSS